MSRIYVKSELEQLTKKELMQLAKENGLPRYHGKSAMTVDELITTLLNFYGTNNVQKEEPVVVHDEDTIESGEVEIPEGEDLPIPENAVVNNIPPVKEYGPWEFKSREKEIEEVEPGTLMAFLDLKGKPRTAAMVNRSSKKKQVKLVTEFNMEFVVPYENILWVRKGNRWPRGIYNLLKGINDET